MKKEEFQSSGTKLQISKDDQDQEKMSRDDKESIGCNQKTKDESCTKDSICTKDKT